MISNFTIINIYIYIYGATWYQVIVTATHRKNCVYTNNDKRRATLNAVGNHCQCTARVSCKSTDKTNMHRSTNYPEEKNRSVTNADQFTQIPQIMLRVLRIEYARELASFYVIYGRIASTVLCIMIRLTWSAKWRMLYMTPCE